MKESRKVYLSFLGNNRYIKCNYFYQEKKIENVRFVQEAMIKFLCKDFKKGNDKFIFFLTEEAEKNNWLNSDLNDNLGLYETLTKYYPVKMIEKVSNFPIGKTQKEIEKMFDIIYSVLEPNDKVVVDVTYSFRYMPMLMVLALSYAKYLKKDITIKGIYYGAFEVLGPIDKIKKIEIKDRNVPIFDFSDFLLLQEWTDAADDFILYSSVTKLMQISDYYMKNEETRDDFYDENKLINYLRLLTTDIYTSNAKSLYQAEYIPLIKELYLKIKSDKSTNKLFLHIIDEIISKVMEFKENSINNGFVATKWCINFNFIQQGYTILLETIITVILNDLKIDYLDLDFREIVIFACEIFDNYKDLKNDLKYKEVSKLDRIYEHRIFHREDTSKILNKIVDLKNIRNYLNHAGIRKNSIQKSKITRKLSEFYDFFKGIFGENK